MYILIELSELVSFGYDLSETLDRHRCCRNGIYILLLTSSPHDKDSCERSRVHGSPSFLDRVVSIIEICSFDYKTIAIL